VRATIQFDEATSEFPTSVGPIWWVLVLDGDREVANEHSLARLGGARSGQEYSESGIREGDLPAWRLEAAYAKGATTGLWSGPDDQEKIISSLRAFWPGIEVQVLPADPASAAKTAASL
jgi:hypothetical protein